MTVHQYIDYLLVWLEEQRAHLYASDGYTLGVSGGIDSAVCLHLLAKTGKPVQALVLPINANANDCEDAELVLKNANISGNIIALDDVYTAAQNTLAPVLNRDYERMPVLNGNLMARLRMVMLYTVAQSHRSVVVGTDNAVEYYLGYFTKFGDGACDILPLAKLTKSEVGQLAKALGVPKKIREKAPSAGLWQGQTDENEIGVSYADLDAFLSGKTVDDAVREKIAYWHQRSHHKRMLPPMPEIGLSLA